MNYMTYNIIYFSWWFYNKDQLKLIVQNVRDSVSLLYKFAVLIQQCSDLILYFLFASRVRINQFRVTLRFHYQTSS
jgi:hypothetical protein